MFRGCAAACESTCGPEVAASCRSGSVGGRSKTLLAMSDNVNGHMDGFVHMDGVATCVSVQKVQNLVILCVCAGLFRHITCACLLSKGQKWSGPLTTPRHAMGHPWDCIGLEWDCHPRKTTEIKKTPGRFSAVRQSHGLFFLGVLFVLTVESRRPENESSPSVPGK